MSYSQFAQSIADLIASHTAASPVLSPLVGNIYHIQPPTNALLPMIVLSEQEYVPSAYFNSSDDVSATIEITHWSSLESGLDAARIQDNFLVERLKNQRLEVDGFINTHMQLTRRDGSRVKNEAIANTSYWQITATGTQRRTDE